LIKLRRPGVMKLFKAHRKAAVAGLAFVVAVMAGGVAFAFWTSPGSGSGAAQTGSTTPLLIDQLGGTPMYNSTTDGSYYQWSYSFNGGTGANELGNKITLAGGGGPVSDVVVAMANFNPTSGSLPLTLNLYNPGSYGGPGSAPGSLIDSVTQSFAIPNAPSGGYGGTYCTSVRVSDPNSDCGINNFNITFNLSSLNITLPSTIVYGIEFPNPQPDFASGVNVQLSYEPTNISVGLDADPGYLFVSTANGENDSTGGSSGEITCDNVSATFGEYPTAVGADGCGETTSSTAPYPPVALVPAVEFDSSTMSDLYPGGPAQPVSFSITNPGTIPETVNSVTISVTGTSDNTDCNTTNFAMLNGDDSSGTAASTVYTAGFPLSIPAGGTVNLTPATTGAYLYMQNLDVNQDGCQNTTVDLGFSSN
jgi:hypothetical protein